MRISDWSSDVCSSDLKTMMPRLLLALIAPFVLTGCLLSPGKFTSELTLEQDGSFAFTYNGEIVFLGLSKLARMNSGNEVFEPKSFVDEDRKSTRLNSSH